MSPQSGQFAHDVEQTRRLAQSALRAITPAPVVSILPLKEAPPHAASA